MVLIVVLGVLFLAYANGANDNFKGVATLYGSGVAGYRTALLWGTGTTLCGSLLALVLAAGLVKTFSAKGLVPDAVAASPTFLAAAALSAAATVLLATRLGLPVSTTHALTGALTGAGLVGAAAQVRFAVLGKAFFLPLLLSPVVSMALTAALYPLLRRARLRLGITAHSCVCVDGAVAPGGLADGVAAAAQLPVRTCQAQPGGRGRYQGRILGISAQRLLDGLHFLSAGAVGFARGLNDAPKIFALLLATKLLPPQGGVALIGCVMAVGGVLHARRVAETLAHRITPLNDGQGFVANLVTAALVLLASRFGLPVSTTHVATGGIVGIGAVRGSAAWGTVGTILLAWGTTLPLGALLGAAAFAALRLAL